MTYWPIFWDKGDVMFTTKAVNVPGTPFLFAVEKVLNVLNLNCKFYKILLEESKAKKPKVFNFIINYTFLGN